MIICSGNRELSVYEALVCGGVNRTTTTEHFHKVLGYGIVDIYFLVIYAFAADINPLLDSVEEIARDSLPSHTVLDTIKPLGPPNHETRGFLANYKIDRRDAAVVFLVADLAQGALKIAHAAPSTAPAPKRKKAVSKAPAPAKTAP